MAIADIFEALTASDRPYKRAKPLSEAVQILSSLKAVGHIDPDLFDLFLTSEDWIVGWAAQASADTIDNRLRLLRQAINADRRIGRACRF